MSRPTASEIIRILIVVAILIILLIGFIFLKIKSALPPVTTEKQSNGSTQTYEPAGTLLLNPKKINTSLGQEFTVDILLSAPGKNISGADAVITYDASYLEALEVVPSELFQNYARKEIDNSQGTVKITAFTLEQSTNFSNNSVYAKIKLRSVKKGSTRILPDFEKGSTNKSTIVEAKTAANILEEVVPAEVVID